MAEREGFEPSMSLWPILTFQASAFDHSATAPHALERMRPRVSEGVSQGRGLCKSAGMRKLAFIPLLLAAAPAPKPAEPARLAPSEIVAAAPKADWVAIAPSDLLVMDLAPDYRGKSRRVVIQLMPPPFSQGWIGNIRKLAAAHWWDGLSINRVQDNYVVQWGDASEKKALPPELVKVPESEYVHSTFLQSKSRIASTADEERSADRDEEECEIARNRTAEIAHEIPGNFGSCNWPAWTRRRDPYQVGTGYYSGWQLGLDVRIQWPVHCYGMVGVGRDLPPDTGTGAELYTVIGQAPRHLDRNIALVGRVIEGIEHLSSLPRGTGALGFYEKPEERTGIATVRLGNEVAGLPAYEYLSTESASFARYADARANRRDAFFIRPAGGADICNIPVPVRRAL